MSRSRWVIGQHACFEAVSAHPEWVQEVSIFEGKAKEQNSLSQLLTKKNIKPKIKGKKFFNELGEGHQGYAVLMKQRPEFSEERAQDPTSLVIFLDGITDPHNLGAILRSAWLLGAHGLFIPKNRSVDLTPSATKVASGGAEHVPVEACHFPSQLEWFKEQGYWVYALSEKADQGLHQLKFAEKSVLVVGAEDKGVRSSTASFCDAFISIPQVSQGPSFNASVALSICAFEWARQKLF
jgi:23S rRNA (guanosine2251-2'-O)-methyltransferase